MNIQIRGLDEEIADLKSTAAARESDLESALGRLRSVEEQYARLQAEHTRTRNEFDVLQREYDLLKVLIIILYASKKKQSTNFFRDSCYI